MKDRWRVYIGGFKEIDLRGLAARWGSVLDAEIRREDTGQSKGFGWVDMRSREEALAVLEGIRALENSRLTATVLNPPEMRDLGPMKWPPESRYGSVPERERSGGIGERLTFQPIELADLQRFLLSRGASSDSSPEGSAGGDPAGKP
jgi:hypothetical protein